RRVVPLDRAWRADPASYAAAGSDRLQALRGVERPARQRFGLVGWGRIGRATAARAVAFGFEVAAHDPFVALDEIRPAATPVDLDELLATSDVVSLHLPLTEDTRGMI